MTDRTILLGLYAHTDQGTHALQDLLEANVATEFIEVIGDLGTPAGQAGALHHATFDTLHLPRAHRERVMDGIRSGGVVLAVRGPAGDSRAEEILNRHNPVLVERTDAAAPNPSHNLLS